jgi:hypothetical protein
MNYDEAKDETIMMLSAVLDKTLAIVRTAFIGHGITTRAKKVDYVTQVIVLNFPDQQPSTDLVDAVGGEVRHIWPDAPPITTTFFKVSDMNADLIIDFNHPSGIKALAEAGDVKALAAVAAGVDYLPVVHYILDRIRGEGSLEAGMMSVHERPL